jgi:hypothetical protein
MSGGGFTVSIAFVPVAEQLPDAETNVLLYSEELGFFEGFCDGTDALGLAVFRDVTAVEVMGVTHWAAMPERTQA